MKVLALSLLLVIPLLPQSQPSIPPRFTSTTGDVSLTAVGTSFTIQQSATPTKRIQLERAVVYCSVPCTATQTENGTAATATAGVVVGVQPTTISGTATAWTSSNVGAGSTVGGITHIPADSTLILDLSQIFFANHASTNTNYTITIGTITGTTNITFIWSEQ